MASGRSTPESGLSSPSSSISLLPYYFGDDEIADFQISKTLKVSVRQGEVPYMLLMRYTENMEIDVSRLCLLLQDWRKLQALAVVVHKIVKSGTADGHVKVTARPDRTEPEVN